MEVSLPGESSRAHVCVCVSRAAGGRLFHYSPTDAFIYPSSYCSMPQFQALFGVILGVRRRGGVLRVDNHSYRQAEKCVYANTLVSFTMQIPHPA